MVIAGRSSLLELPEYTDIDRLKKLILALEDGRSLLDLITIYYWYFSTFKYLIP